jgi:diphthamide synthase (EF-2-diphthine--ammonia ligase)
VALTPLFPLWGQGRRSLVEDMITAGQKTKIVSCNERLGEAFLGRVLDAPTLADLEAAGVDACGENGEYHTFVFDCGEFSRPIAVREGRRYQRHIPRKTRAPDDYWFLELRLAA